LNIFDKVVYCWHLAVTVCGLRLVLQDCRRSHKTGRIRRVSRDRPGHESSRGKTDVRVSRASKSCAIYLRSLCCVQSLWRPAGWTLHRWAAHNLLYIHCWALRFDYLWCCSLLHCFVNRMLPSVFFVLKFRYTCSVSDACLEVEREDYQNFYVLHYVQQLCTISRGGIRTPKTLNRLTKKFGVGDYVGNECLCMPKLKTIAPLAWRHMCEMHINMSSSYRYNCLTVSCTECPHKQYIMSNGTQ